MLNSDLVFDYALYLQSSLYYKATPSAKILWPYTAGGLLLEVNFNRKYSPVSLQGGLIIEGGLWSQGPYNRGWPLVTGAL